MNTMLPSLSTSHESLVRRIRSEFLEMPGLKLTRDQARRLWALDDESCRSVLDALVEVNFLVRRTDGQYVRPSEGVEAPRRMAKAQIRDSRVGGVASVSR